MKTYNFIEILMKLMLLPMVGCFRVHNPYIKRSKNSEISSSIGPSVEDKAVLFEALNLLNMGKKALGLSTENAELLLRLVDNSSEKANQIQQALHDPQKKLVVPKSEQYLVLSGEDGHFHVDNFTNMTEDSSGAIIPPGNDSGIEELFKIVMEKKYPETYHKGKVFHKITIVESSEEKPFEEKDVPRYSPAVATLRAKPYKTRSLKRFFNFPRSRKKRMKDEFNVPYPLERHRRAKHISDDYASERNWKTIQRHKLEQQSNSLYPNRFMPLYFSHRISFLQPDMVGKTTEKTVTFPEENKFIKDEFQNKVDSTTKVTQQILTSTEKSFTSVETIPFDPQGMLYIEKSLIAHLLDRSVSDIDKESRSGLFVNLAAIIFIFSVCFIFGLLLYRKCWAKRSSNLLEFKGANVIMRLGESMSCDGKRKLLNIPFGKVDYRMVPMDEPELEWQSEVGEWITDAEIEVKEDGYHI